MSVSCGMRLLVKFACLLAILLHTEPFDVHVAQHIVSRPGWGHHGGWQARLKPSLRLVRSYCGRLWSSILSLELPPEALGVGVDLTG